MIDATTLPLGILKQTSQLIVDEAVSRGWSALIPYEGSSLLQLTRPDGKVLNVFSSVPSTTSFAAAYTADDKFATYRRLEAAGDIPQLTTELVSPATCESVATTMLQAHDVVVIKPVDGAHGNGVTTRLRAVPDIATAILRALQYTSRKDVLIQQQYQSPEVHEVRILCIAHKFVGAIYRQPARVYGDGRSPIRELIEQENEKPDRGVPYKARLATISVDDALRYLGDDGQRIPAQGEEVQVLSVANYGMGGETIDVTESIPNWLIAQAEKVTEAMELPLAGVDYMLALRPSKDLGVDELRPIVVEVNKAPSLSIHDAPTTGIPRDATKTYVTYLESL